MRQGVGFKGAFYRLGLSTNSVPQKFGWVLFSLPIDESRAGRR